MSVAVKILAALQLLLIGGCVAPSPDEKGAPSESTPQTLSSSGKLTASAAYATIAVDDTSDEPELVQWLRWNGVRVEKDTNGDMRVFDSPTCRRILVQYRRLLRLRLNVIAGNMLHFNTTHDERGEKNPYRRRIVVADKSGSVVIKTDPEPFLKRYEPGNPDASADGYVLYPNIDRAVEFVNGAEASSALKLVTGILQRFDATFVGSSFSDPQGALPMQCDFAIPEDHQPCR